MGDYLNTRDACYGNPPDDYFFVAPKGVAAMIGVKHTKLKMSVFNNAGVSWIDYEYSYARWVDDREMETCGTWGNSTDNSDLWVGFFKREGSTFKCPEGSCCFTMEGDSVPPPDAYFPILYGERSYLNPKTKTGPAFDEILGVRVMTFDPPQ